MYVYIEDTLVQIGIDRFQACEAMAIQKSIFGQLTQYPLEQIPMLDLSGIVYVKQ